MADAVNMSLDEIIKQNQQNRTGRTRGRGGGNIRGRGGGRGGRRGRGGRGGMGGRNLEEENMSNGRQTRSRSRSRGPRGRSASRGRTQARGRSQSRARSQSRTRSRSRQRTRSNSRPRSASRSQQFRGLTPRGRAGLEDQQFDMPPLTRSNRGGMQMRLRRSNSNPNLQGNVHSRLGTNNRRGGLQNRSMGFTNRGISKRGRGLSTRNKFTNIGLRSDQILMEQQNMIRNNNIIRSQTFTRSRNNSFSSGAQLTVSVANDFARKRRNSMGSANYLNKNSLAQLNNEFGGYRTRRGPGSAKSIGSNKSNLSNRSDQSNSSRKSNRSRGRGRGGNRGVGRKFITTQVLNPQLQNEIAIIQGKTGRNLRSEKPAGIELNFTPVPAATEQTLHQRFAHA